MHCVAPGELDQKTDAPPSYQLHVGDTEAGCSSLAHRLPVLVVSRREDVRAPGVVAYFDCSVELWGLWGIYGACKCHQRWAGTRAALLNTLAGGSHKARVASCCLGADAVL